MNSRYTIILVSIAAIAAFLYVAAERQPHTALARAALPDIAPVGASLLEGLGDHSMQVTPRYNAGLIRA